MSLAVRSTLYLMVLALAIFGFAGWQVDRRLREVVREEVDEGLWRQWQLLEPVLASLDTPSQQILPDLHLHVISRLPKGKSYGFSDTLMPEEADEPEELEVFRKLTVYSELAGQSYRVELVQSNVDAEDMQEAIWESLLWAAAALFLGLLVLQWWLARFTWRPFYKVLQALEAYDVERGPVQELGKSRTREFRQLIALAQEMMHRAHDQYTHLRRFSENASHELQTPLAVVRSKLERLLQSPRLAKEEADLMAQALQALQRLSRLNSGLLLLSKIENEQFRETELLDVGQMLREEMEGQKELWELRGIEVEVELEEGYRVLAPRALLEILLRNLLSNAIRHNIAGGKVEMQLHAPQLTLRNTGSQHALDPETVFRRFGREGSAGQSAGLGLAIAKEICTKRNWNLSYTFRDGMHEFVLDFGASSTGL